MATVDKVRIVVVGDSGVGKTSLTHLIANNEALTSPGWTVGCSVEVKLHEYKEGTASQRTFFIELWDVGGSISHKNTRGVFYNSLHGIVLVHDLTNRRSHENLQSWICEIVNRERDGKEINRSMSVSSSMSPLLETSATAGDFDPEQFLGVTQLKQLQIPILVVGTKADLVDDAQRLKQSHRAGNIADQCQADEICLNNHDTRSLAAGTTDAVKLARFFDKVIERKFYPRGEQSVQFAFGADKQRRTTPFSSPFTTPLTSPITSYSQHAEAQYQHNSKQA